MCIVCTLHCLWLLFLVEGFASDCSTDEKVECLSVAISFQVGDNFSVWGITGGVRAGVAQGPITMGVILVSVFPLVLVIPGARVTVLVFLRSLGSHVLPLQNAHFFFFDEMTHCTKLLADAILYTSKCAPLSFVNKASFECPNCNFIVRVLDL